MLKKMTSGASLPSQVGLAFRALSSCSYSSQRSHMRGQRDQGCDRIVSIDFVHEFVPSLASFLYLEAIFSGALVQQAFQSPFIFKKGND